MQENNNSLAMQVIRKLIVCLIITIALLFLSNIAWLIAWCQYDYESVQIEQSTEDEGDNNFIGNDGDITYGDPEDKDNAEDPQELEGEEKEEGLTLNGET